MKINLKTMLCALLLLTLAGATEVGARRFVAVAKGCLANSRVVQGALEMYNMDIVAPIEINGVRPIDRELILTLGEGRYLKNVDEFFDFEKTHQCRKYLVQADVKAPMIIICRNHGASEYSDRNLSPQEQFDLYCSENGMNPGAYQLDLSGEVSSELWRPSPLMAHLANFWPVYVVLSVMFFIIVVRSRS